MSQFDDRDELELLQYSDDDIHEMCKEVKTVSCTNETLRVQRVVALKKINKEFDAAKVRIEMEDFCDNLWQDIVDAVCEAFDCPEASAVRAQDSVSNITIAGREFWIFHTLSGLLRSITHTKRQGTAEYAYNVARYQKYRHTTMFGCIVA